MRGRAGASIAASVMPACVACRKQRKKCGKSCKLAGLFGQEEAEDFEAVRRVFGIKNLLGMVSRVECEEMKRVARDAIVWEARQRLISPLYGSFGLVCQLQAQLVRLARENDALQKQLQLMRQAYARGQGSF